MPRERHDGRPRYLPFPPAAALAGVLAMGRRAGDRNRRLRAILHGDRARARVCRAIPGGSGGRPGFRSSRHAGPAGSPRNPLGWSARRRRDRHGRRLARGGGDRSGRLRTIVVESRAEGRGDTHYRRGRRQGGTWRVPGVGLRTTARRERERATNRRLDRPPADRRRRCSALQTRLRRPQGPLFDGGHLRGERSTPGQPRLRAAAGRARDGDSNGEKLGPARASYRRRDGRRAGADGDRFQLSAPYGEVAHTAN